jgi:hypothetical protein
LNDESSDFSHGEFRKTCWFIQQFTKHILVATKKPFWMNLSPNLTSPVWIHIAVPSLFPVWRNPWFTNVYYNYQRVPTHNIHLMPVA